MAQSEMLPSALEKRRGIVCKDEMNPDLLKERNAASFDPIQLTHVLDGGAQTTARRRYIGEHYASFCCTSIIIYPSVMILVL